MKLPLFSIEVPRTSDESEWLVVAEDATAAASLYVETVLMSGKYSVDEEEVADIGEISLAEVGEVDREGPCVIGWPEGHSVPRASVMSRDRKIIQLSDYASWMAFVDNDFSHPLSAAG